VFQENALFPWNTVIENIMLGMMFQGVAKSERGGRARRSLEAVGLRDFADHYPGQLSGGMRQRAALARALSLETPILLMDEPFGALDEQTRMILGEDLSVLLSRTDKTIVFVTHSLGEAVFLADRVAVFSARPGTIKQIISVDEPHPRKPEFMTSAKFTGLRNQLYGLLHDEIRKAILESGGTPPAARADGVTDAEPA
jgi:NitT/TauT family transport system ATP-binding protein